MFKFDLSIPKEGRERAWWIWIGVLGLMLAVGSIRRHPGFCQRFACDWFV